MVGSQTGGAVGVWGVDVSAAAGAIGLVVFGAILSTIIQHIFNKHVRDKHLLELDLSYWENMIDDLGAGSMNMWALSLSNSGTAPERSITVDIEFTRQEGRSIKHAGTGFDNGLFNVMTTLDTSSESADPIDSFQFTVRALFPGQEIQWVFNEYSEASFIVMMASSEEVTVVGKWLHGKKIPDHGIPRRSFFPWKPSIPPERIATRCKRYLDSLRTGL